MITPVKATNLSSLSGIAHGFFTRRGGVSEGIYKSLNCGFGSDDLPEAVGENRDRVLAFMEGAANLITVYQIHSADVVTVTEPFAREDVPKADAMVTNQPDIALGILTADCVPVLFADCDAQVIGAAHAGWKGAIGGVLQNTVDAMRAIGATDIHAAIGPCIAQASYEVGPDLHDIYTKADEAFTAFFSDSDKPHHFQFDLTGFVENRLRAASVPSIERLDLDTYQNEEDFYSYRRSTHRTEADFGRQISTIALI